MVLTSATLTAIHSFSYLRSRLGLDGEDLPVEELEVPSPFDYENKALLYLPRDLPEPTDPAWLGAAEGRIAELVEASDGGAFVLSTSKRVMQALHGALARGAKRPVLVQGEAPKTALLDRFRRAPNAVLVATMSFWEGACRAPARHHRQDPVPGTDRSRRHGALDRPRSARQKPFAHYHVDCAITWKALVGSSALQQDAGIVALLIGAYTQELRALLQSLPPRNARRTSKRPKPRRARLARRARSARDIEGRSDRFGCSRM